MRGARHRFVSPWGLLQWALPLAFLLVFLVAPVVRLAWEGLRAGSAQGAALWWAPWSDAYLRGRMLWSVAQAGITCAITVLLGVPLGWMLARWNFAGRRALLRLLMLPFVVPTLVAAMGVLAWMGPHGVLMRWWGWDLQGTPWLLLYGNVFFNLCVVVRAVAEGLAQVSAARVAVARTLGASPWRAFWRVEWPALQPWLLSAVCLVFLYCFSGFGLALVLGGQRYGTVEVEIYTLVAHELQLGPASVLALWVLLLLMPLVLTYAALEARRATVLRADGVPRRSPQGLWQWLALAGGLAVLLCFCVLPLVAIAWRAMFSGADVWAVLTEPDTLAAVWNTLRFTAMTVVLATVLGLAHAWAARRSVGMRALAFLPFVVSAVMVAFGLLLWVPSWTASVGLLMAAYALLAYPFVAKAVAAGLDGLPVHYEQAARSLGASPARVFWRVTLPLLAPALRRGMAFAAATAVGEFAVTLCLSRPEWATLTTLIYAHLGRPGEAHLQAALVLSCVLMALALLAFVVLEWGQTASGDSDA